jgi:hypothetical protein
MKNSKISSNDYGVVVISYGTFTMEGGEISGNTAPNRYGSNPGEGGGVYVINGGIFTMKGGKISGNTADSAGGGVYVGYKTNTAEPSGTFTMEGGEISGNGAYNGGGVYVYRGVFTMKDGEISGNTGGGRGGGVYIYGDGSVSSYRGTFIMESGEISGNNGSGDYNDGGGVYVGYHGFFTMKDGEIGGNSNGVYVSSLSTTIYGTFAMEGGTIYGSASSTPTPPPGKENGSALYKDQWGRAYWGENVYYIIGAAPEAGPTAYTVTIVGSLTTAGSTDETLTARK